MSQPCALLPPISFCFDVDCDYPDVVHVAATCSYPVLICRHGLDRAPCLCLVLDPCLGLYSGFVLGRDPYPCPYLYLCHVPYPDRDLDRGAAFPCYHDVIDSYFARPGLLEAYLSACFPS